MASAEAHAGGSDTLLLPTAFWEYLTGRTFANFNPTAQETYAMTRAFQAILTLDDRRSTPSSAAPRSLYARGTAW